MKIKKILSIGVIVALVVIVVAVLVVGFFLGDIVKKGINTFGPQITKVSVTVDSVDVALLAASGKVKGLVIGNPPGYQSTNAISVGVASASISPGSLLSDKIVIKSVRVDAPAITFEGSIFKNNLTDLKGNLSSGASTATNSAAPGKGASRKLEVDDFEITNAKVHVSSSGIDQTLTIPDIHLTNLGTGPDGITVADLTQQVLNQVVIATVQTVATSATGLGKGAEKAAGGAISNATKGLGNLFK